MSEQFLRAWAVDEDALRALVGSKDPKLVARAKRRAGADEVEELLEECGTSIDETLGAIVAGDLVAKHAYRYRRALELALSLTGASLAPAEIVGPGRGWQALGPAFARWGAPTLAKRWGGGGSDNPELAWPWSRAPKGASVDWPNAYVVSAKEASAIAKELAKLTAARVVELGVPKGIERFSDGREWPLEDLAPEVATIAKDFRRWCVALGKKHPDRSMVVIHDGQS